MKEAEFQETVLKDIAQIGDEAKVVKSQSDQLVADYGRLDKQSKDTFEGLGKLQKEQASVDEIVRQIAKVQKCLKFEARAAWGSPIERISNDEEMRLRFNLAIRQAVNTDRSYDHVIEPMKKALGEDTSPGSTLITNALAKEIYDTLPTHGVWNTFAVRNLGTKITDYPVKTVRPIANWILTEGSTIADDTNKAGVSVALTAKLCAVLLDVSRQLIQDAEIDVTADVLTDFAEAVALRLDFAALQADGTADATNGGFSGVFDGGTAAVAAAGNVTTELTDLDDWVKCLTTVDPAVLSRPSRWWMHPQIIARALLVRDSNGRPIFQLANEAPNPSGLGSILGYPVTPALAAPSANTINSTIAVFGDPGALVFGIRQDFTFEASDHHGFATFERSFRATARAGCIIRRALGFAVLTLPAA